MNLSRQRRRQRRSLPVGWLFADLFLVLFVLALAAVPVPKLATHVKAASSHVAHPKPTKKPVKKHGPAGVEKTPTNICVSQGDSGPALLAAFDQEVASKHLTGHKAGFILVFATAPDPGTGVATAQSALALIQKDDPDRAAFSGAGGEGLWGGQSDTGSCPSINGGTDNYHFQVFFYLSQ